MNNSSGYTNAVLFLVYLFVAVFILLSMFLAILGEAQAQVRTEQEDARETGTAPPEYGVFSHARERLDEYWEEFGHAGSGRNPAPAATGSAEGGGGSLESLAGEAESSIEDAEIVGLRQAFDSQLADLRGEIGAVARQLRALRPAPPPNEGVTVQEVVQRFEDKLDRRLAHLEERLEPHGSDGVCPPAHAGMAPEVVKPQRRRRRTIPAAARAGLVTGTSAESASSPGRVRVAEVESTME